MLATQKSLIMSLIGKNLIRHTWPGRPDILSMHQIKSYFGISGIVHIDLNSVIKSKNEIKLIQTKYLINMTVKDKVIKLGELCTVIRNICDTLTKNGVWIILVKEVEKRSNLVA